MRLDYLKRVYGHDTQGILHEEQQLKKLELESEFNPRITLNLAHNLNKQKRHPEAREKAQELHSMLEDPEFADRHVERLECLKIISHSHYHESIATSSAEHEQEAERYMLLAIETIEEYWGSEHSWVPEFKNVLEGWLRKVG